MQDFDLVRLNFSETGLFVLNICLGFVMYGVSLELTLSDFTNLRKQPKAAFIGLFSQLVLLPAVTIGLLYILKPHPGIALGMILVAACPGGNMSNFITLLSKGNVPLSISLTATTTALAWFFTPFNFFFWGKLYAPAADRLKEISLNPIDVFLSIFLILILPLLLGAATNRFAPKFASSLKKPLRISSTVLLGLFILVALIGNWKSFLDHVGYLFWIVLLHNGSALLVGYLAAWIVGLGHRDRKTISLETGLQNSGLGLILIFTFFQGIGSMALIAAWWGVWHLISGLGLAAIWGREKAES
ncbi:bile acid:sodium symporter family protein [Leptospira wolffii]|uniref:Symporter n=1 Tax=Leptospira wolffii TaxID=409998 RepID=A0A2M9ZAC6_9LEPT|nr:bile acid:sodium symporter family protein [Leptospira wolffii]PJZ65297.1 symporter [Leptospira wolffii]TGK64823.1 bile acid:sodium symporter family protein [Leptospira wolffii]TGK76778.1 bile acid:sodium symporter family protein [Leptospira wolffii]TGK77370.1 bile acid:sodium symporter family protein [Leptospira wolffii]TGL26765.1 bile acid:sodium symporter family protein [Leptospira wolffii]